MATDRSFKDYLIPYYSCSYKSALSKEEILSRIRRRTEAERYFRSKGIFSSNKKTKEYEGKVDVASFKISRINKSKKSNASVVIGSLISSNQYTAVNVNIRLNLLVMVIVPIWIFITSQLFFDNQDFGNFGEDFNFATFLPLVILLILYVALTASFHFTLTKDLKFLKEVIEPVDTNESGASWIIRN